MFIFLLLFSEALARSLLLRPHPLPLGGIFPFRVTGLQRHLLNRLQFCLEINVEHLSAMQHFIFVLLVEMLSNLRGLTGKVVLHQFAVVFDEAAIDQQGAADVRELLSAFPALFVVVFESADLLLREFHVAVGLFDEAGQVVDAQQPVQDVGVGLVEHAVGVAAGGVLRLTLEGLFGGHARSGRDAGTGQREFGGFERRFVVVVHDCQFKGSADQLIIMAMIAIITPPSHPPTS
jgi:hypothetical protein